MVKWTRDAGSHPRAASNGPNCATTTAATNASTGRRGRRTATATTANSPVQPAAAAATTSAVGTGAAQQSGRGGDRNQAENVRAQAEHAPPPATEEGRRPRRSVLFVADTLRPREVASLDSRVRDVQLQGRTLWLSLHGEAHFRSLRVRDPVTEEEVTLARNRARPAASQQQQQQQPLPLAGPTTAAVSPGVSNAPRGVHGEGQREQGASSSAAAPGLVSETGRTAVVGSLAPAGAAMEASAVMIDGFGGEVAVAKGLPSSSSSPSSGTGTGAAAGPASGSISADDAQQQPIASCSNGALSMVSGNSDGASSSPRGRNVVADQSDAASSRGYGCSAREGGVDDGRGSREDAGSAAAKVRFVARGVGVTHDNPCRSH